MQGFEGRAFADRNHHATPPRGGEGFEIRRSPIRVTVVLGGVDPVMEAEQGMSVRFRLLGGSAAYGPSGSGQVFHNDRKRAELVFSYRLLKDPDENVTAPAGGKRYDDSDRFFGKRFLGARAKAEAGKQRDGEPKERSHADGSQRHVPTLIMLLLIEKHQDGKA